MTNKYDYFYTILEYYDVTVTMFNAFFKIFA